MTTENRSLMKHAEQSAVESFGKDKVELLRQTICQDLTTPEMALFIEVCTAKRLDPFARQIHALKRRSKKKVRKGTQWVEEWVEKMTITTGIDGFRVIAQRTGQYEGQLGPFWCGEDGVWKDVWLSQKAPRAAKVAVMRKGFREPLVGVTLWDEYAQSYEYNGQVKYTGTWATHPSVMLAKTAEAIALRRAFPEDLSGLYVSEEMKTEDLADDMRQKFNELDAKMGASESQTPPSSEPRQLESPQVMGPETEKPAPRKISATETLISFKRSADACATAAQVEELCAKWADAIKALPPRATAIAMGYAKARAAEVSDCAPDEQSSAFATQLNELAKE